MLQDVEMQDLTIPLLVDMTKFFITRIPSVYGETRVEVNLSFLSSVEYPDPRQHPDFARVQQEWQKIATSPVTLTQHG